MKGMIIGGDVSGVVIRQKSDAQFELGELLIAESGASKTLLEVFDLCYGSQLSEQQVQLMSGLQLEEDTQLQLYEPHLRHYVLAKARALIKIESGNASVVKHLPPVFCGVRAIVPEDLRFLDNPAKPLCFGLLRSGSSTLPVSVILDGAKVLSHHVLVSGTTGRGKSVCMANMLWRVLGSNYASVLVLDAHDEYYAGFQGKGLKDHPQANSRLVYYSKNPLPGGCSLKLSLEQVFPQHLELCAEWSDAQREALYTAFRLWRKEWISRVLTASSLENVHEGTLQVLKRRIMHVLALSVANGVIECQGIFDASLGQTTVQDIVRDLRACKSVVVDTSELSGSAEVLVASMLAQELLEHNKRCSPEEIHALPVVSIVLEEAPRVLGKDVLSRGQNIFSSIAREGRKFKVGLIAITQLPSLIPKEVLANLNTKIILGTELKLERQALIESAAQDLSQDDRMIASLDKGEGVISSVFSKFALPVKFPWFADVIHETVQESLTKSSSAARAGVQLVMSGIKGVQK